MPLSLTGYDFVSPRKIVFGWGRRHELGGEARRLAKRAWIVSGSRTLEQNGTLEGLLDGLRSAGVECHHASTLAHEPEVADVDALVADLLQSGARTDDCFIAVGGGSAMDLAKAAAALVANRKGASVLDYLEGVGHGLKLSNPPLPVIALPTTAGTGTEATKNAVITSYEPPFKKSLRSEWMVPAVVIVDPELTVGLPPRTTAYTGMDAITQLIESYISNRAKPIPQSLCLQGLALAVPAIIEAVEDGTSQRARTAMSHAALLSGLALANSGLGIAHGVAAALGAHARVPHGLACAVMLPVAISVNRATAAESLAAIGRTIWNALRESRASGGCQYPESLLPDYLPNPDEAVSLVIDVIDWLCLRLQIPRTLSEIGVRREQLPAIVAGSQGSSMDGNPRPIGIDELTAILSGMFELA